MPTSFPSSNYPTSYPTSCPTVHPTNQPTGQPSSSPTTLPIVNNTSYKLRAADIGWTVFGIIAFALFAGYMCYSRQIQQISKRDVTKYESTNNSETLTVAQLSVGHMNHTSNQTIDVIATRSIPISQEVHSANDCLKPSYVITNHSFFNSPRKRIQLTKVVPAPTDSIAELEDIATPIEENVKLPQIASETVIMDGQGYRSMDLLHRSLLERLNDLHIVVEEDNPYVEV